MIGSAIRKPRIQPGPRLGQGRLDDRGADDGHGHGVAELGHQGPLAEGLGVGVGVGPTERLGPGLARPSTICFFTQSSRRRSARSASRWSPAPPSSPRARLAKPASRVGARDSASMSPRCRRAAATSVRQSTSTREAVAVEQLLSGLALVGPGHVGGGDREEVDRTGAALLGGQLPGLHHGRGHPRRAEQVDLDGGVERGVEADGAAEWIDDVALGQQLHPSSSRPSPSVATSPATADTREATSASKRSPSSLAEAVEAVVLQDLLGGPLHGGRPVDPGRMSSTTRLSGTLRSNRSTRAVPRNPVAPVMKNCLPPRASRTRVTGSVYHMVSERVEHPERAPRSRRAWIGAVPAAARPRSRGGPRRRGDAPPSGSSTPPWSRSPPVVTTLRPWTPWPQGLEIRKQTILYWFPSKEVLLEAVIDRSADRAVGRARGLVGRGRHGLVPGGGGGALGVPPGGAATRAAGAGPGDGPAWELRPPPVWSPPSSPWSRRASEFLEAEMDAGHMRRHEPRLLLLAIYSTVIGMLTEVEVLRAFGEEPTARSLVRRRNEILELLRSALVDRPRDSRRQSEALAALRSRRDGLGAGGGGRFGVYRLLASGSGRALLCGSAVDFRAVVFAGPVPRPGRRRWTAWPVSARAARLWRPPPSGTCRSGTAATRPGSGRAARRRSGVPKNKKVNRATKPTGARRPKRVAHEQEARRRRSRGPGWSAG